MRKVVSWILLVVGTITFVFYTGFMALVSIGYVGHTWGTLAGVVAFFLAPLTIVVVPIYLGVTMGVWKMALGFIGIGFGLLLQNVGRSMTASDKFMDDLKKRADERERASETEEFADN